MRDPSAGYTASTPYLEWDDDAVGMGIAEAARVKEWMEGLVLTRIRGHEIFRLRVSTSKTHSRFLVLWSPSESHMFYFRRDPET